MGQVGRKMLDAAIKHLPARVRTEQEHQRDQGIRGPGRQAAAQEPTVDRRNQIHQKDRQQQLLQHDGEFFEQVHDERHQEHAQSRDEQTPLEARGSSRVRC